MTYNRVYVMNQIKRVIETAPALINTYRTEYISDGYGGRKKVKDNELIHENLKCIFDNSGSPNLTAQASLGGIVFDNSPIKLWIAYDPLVDLRIGDVVKVTALGRSYVIQEVTNILAQNLLFEVRLELRD